MTAVPDGSIYFWMYEQGLKQVPIQEIELACRMAGKEIRGKDYDNYWNGWHRSSLYDPSARDVFKFACDDSCSDYLSTRLCEYPMNPNADKPEVQNRWIPCTADGKPLIKWGSGCMSKVDAQCLVDCRTLGENLKGTKHIVIDCDGDHGEGLDHGTIMFLSKYMGITHALYKPASSVMYEMDGDMVEIPASFHLTFKTDRLIPTSHHPAAHVDICGNAKNQARYLKNKKWNGLEPIEITDEIWEDIKSFIRERECNGKH